jgi:Tol biopolymer transport system component
MAPLRICSAITSLIVLLAVALLPLLAPRAAHAAAGATTLVSAAVAVDTLGHSQNAVVSANGRVVAFESTAANLVPNDTNGVPDIFVRDLQTGQIERVSVTSGGLQAEHASFSPAISADGRYVAFESLARRLVPVATEPESRHIYVRDREARTTILVSVTPTGQAASGDSFNPAISADGRFVAFDSFASNLVNTDRNGFRDVFVRDLTARTTRLVPASLVGVQANNDSSNPAISGDGRYVAFESLATNLVNNAGTQRSIYVRNLDGLAVISVASRGVNNSAPNGPSFNPVLSHDGLTVAFNSDASNLVDGDRNGVTDVFVRDRTNSTTVLVSAAPDGTAGNSPSFQPSISANGMVVAFTSAASFRAGDANTEPMSILVRDLSAANTLTRVSGAAAGAADGPAARPALAGDGATLVFESLATNLVAGDTNGASDVFVRNLGADTTERVSLPSAAATGNGWSNNSAVSADGRFVAFASTATNLIAGDTNGVSDIFVRDRETGAVERVSVATGGMQADGFSDAPAISADGRFVAFESAASNLVEGDTNGVRDIFVHDRATGETRRVSVLPDGTQVPGNAGVPALSADGRVVAFQAAINSQWHVFVRDLETQTTWLVSVGRGSAAANDSSANPAISADGCLVTFDSAATNLVTDDTNEVRDVFVYDCRSRTLSRVSVATGGGQATSVSLNPAISADGRFVAFESDAADLVTGDTNGAYDIFVHDRATGETSRVSLAAGGAQANNDSSNPAISGDGRYVAFESDAADLVTGDTNGAYDIFVHDRVTSETSRVSVATGEGQADRPSEMAAISADGRVVAFASMATNLTVDDRNEDSDVFVFALDVPIYRISGRITGTTGQGLAGVTVMAGPYRATTDADGSYVIDGVLAGNYTLTPARAGYHFSPASRALTVNASLSGQDFRALAAGAGAEGHRVYLPLAVR